MIGASGSQHGLEGIYVLLPQFPFFEIPFVEFPALLRIANAFLQPFFLFILRDVQKELKNGRPALMEQLLEFFDLIKPLLHHLVRYPPMNAGDEHVLIV